MVLVPAQRAYLSEMLGVPADIGARDVGETAPLPIKWVRTCQSNETNVVTNAAVTADIADYVMGRQSLQVNVNSGATADVKCTLPNAIHVRGNVGITLKIADLSKADYIRLKISEDDGTNGYYWEVYRRSGGYSNQFFFENGVWRSPVLYRTHATNPPPGHPEGGSFGSPSAWGTTDENAEYPVAWVDVQIVATSGQSPVVTLGQVYSQDWGAAGFIFYSDDGFATCVDLWNILKGYRCVRAPRGIPLTIALNPGHLGMTVQEAYNGYYNLGSHADDLLLTEAQVDALYADGVAVCNHGDVHGGPPNFDWGAEDSTATVWKDMLEGQQKMLDKGWTRAAHACIYPGAKCDTSTHEGLACVSGAGYKVARGMVVRPNAAENWDWWATHHAWMPHNMLSLSHIAWNEATMAGAIRDHHIYPFITHQVMEGGGLWGNTPAEIRAMLDFLMPYIESGEVIPMSVDDYYRRVWAARQQLHLESRSIP